MINTSIRDFVICSGYMDEGDKERRREKKNEMRRKFAADHVASSAVTIKNNIVHQFL